MGFNILLVENSRTTRALMSKLLTGEGFDVTTANNGSQAIESVKDTAFDLILMDLYMPQLNGYEAAKMIRDLPDTNCKDVPIIALTASTDSNDIKICEDAGMNEFFLKSMGEKELVSLLNRYRGDAS